jgi:AmmeMemoRadiSam system protein B
MRRVLLLALVPTLLVVCAALSEEPQPPPTRAQVEGEMGLPSDGDVTRGQLDAVGFPVTAAQAEDVVARAREAEQEELAAQDARLGMAAGDGFVGGVCPHDDHLYAGRVYVHLTERVTAPRVVLVGVFHKARLWELEGKLVLDSFRSWHGPWGPVAVDPLRDELLGRLAPESALVSNTMHCQEHSLEALVPFLQARNRAVTIVPILAPYMAWARAEQLAEELSTALARAMNAHGWKLGRDLAVVVSSDAVHYGEDFDHAPFGTDCAAYERATARDRELVRDHLAGPLEAVRLRGLLEALVDPANVRSYRIPWCGRFSIPFGLELLRRVAAKTGQPAPVGHLLRYGTSLSEPTLPVSQATRDAGLGFTAPSNLHHWVGYAAVGYTLPKPGTGSGTGG